MKLHLDPDDFISKTATFTFEGDTSSQCMKVTIADDSEAEDPEYFELEFSTDPIDRVTVVEGNGSSVMIYDNDRMYKE